MEYLYPPLYKYIAIFIIIFLFLKFYKQITPDKYLIISILITLLFVSLDYMMISNQPSLFSLSVKEPKKSEANEMFDDIMIDDE